MELLTIQRPIRVLVRVTEEFKDKLKEHTQREIQRIDTEVEQLEFQKKRWMNELAKTDPKKLQNLRESVDRELNERKKRQAELQAQGKQAERLEVGELVQQGTVQASAEISPGDRWDELMNVSVVVEDGEVKEIRHGRGGDE